MIALEIRFLTHRFHATPWGQHVNEGAVEWPISPWRLMRLLIATWYQKASELPEETVRAIILKLSSPPKYFLPAASQAHTRHYMPLFKDKTTKVLDAFVLVQEPVGVVWDLVELTSEERAAFKTLTGRVGYLGRAESLVEILLHDDWSGRLNSTPAENSSDSQSERVRLLAPDLDDDFRQWRVQEMERRLQALLNQKREAAVAKGKDASKEKISPKEQAKLDGSLPVDLFQALRADTETLRSAGWNRPPGSRWVDYLRPRDAFTFRQPMRSAKEQAPTVARFALVGKVRPQFTDAVLVAERFRTAAMSKSRQLEGNAAPVFSGKSNLGERLDDDHKHAHFLPEAPLINGRQNITRLTIYSPAPFSETETKALRQIREIVGKSGHTFQCVLLAMGHPNDFDSEEVAEPNLCGRSQTWVSRTPFVLSRHPKTYRDGRPKLDTEGRQKDGPEAQLIAELRRRALPVPIQIEQVQGTYIGGRFVAWRKFRRERTTGGGAKVSNLAYGFRINFPIEVSGPIALGYACHFGLGQFVPE